MEAPIKTDDPQFDRLAALATYSQEALGVALDAIHQMAEWGDPYATEAQVACEKINEILARATGLKL
jgi:hypothetical protein